MISAGNVCPVITGKRIFKVSLAIAAGAACVAPFARAVGGEAEGAAVGGLEEVVVTARRVEENIQRVPITVIAFTQERLQQADIRDATALQVITPAVNMCCTAWNNATLTVVRGIQNGTPTYFAEAPVSPVGFANYFDIANVQVLKGPQGTLFGQASVAGAFVFEPRKPGDSFGGYVSVAAGTYDRRTVEGAVDLPIADNRLALRLAAISHYRRGYVHDLSINKYYGDEDYYVLRPSLRWNITDSLENYTLFQYSYGQNSGQGNGIWVLQDFNFNPAHFSASATLTALNGGSAAAFAALKDQMLATQLQMGPYKMLGLSVGCASPTGAIRGPAQVTSLDYPRAACPRDWHRDRLLVNHTTWRVNETWSIKNIFSMDRSEDFTAPQDVEGTPLIMLNFGSPRNLSAAAGPDIWSDELQVVGSIGRFSITAGTFHTARKTDAGVIFATSPSNLAAGDTASRGIPESSTHAFYAQSDINLTDQLTGTLGARYTKDKIETTQYAVNPVTLAETLIISPSSPNGNGRFSNTSYTAGLRYQFTPETMFFFTNSRGFSAGQLQNVVGFEKVEPAVLTNYELGIKSTFGVGNARARVNASIFYGKFDNVQVQTFLTVTNSITGAVGPANIIRNAAKADIRGAEGEVTFAPSERYEVGVSFAYLNNKYTEWPSQDPLTRAPIDLSGTEFIRSPKWKTDLHVTWNVPIASNLGELSLTADWAYRTKVVHVSRPPYPLNPAIPNSGLICSRQRTAANGYGPLSADGGTSYIDCKPGYSNVDLNARWRGVMGHENATVSFSVTNLTENTITGSQADLETSTGSVSFQPAVPRMFAVRLTYDF